MAVARAAPARRDRPARPRPSSDLGRRHGGRGNVALHAPAQLGGRVLTLGLQSRAPARARGPTAVRGSRQAAGRPGRAPRHGHAIRARRQLAAGVRRPRGAETARRPQRAQRPGRRALREALSLADLLRACVPPRRRAATAGGRSRGRRQGLVGRQSDRARALPRLLRRAGAAGRRARVRLRAERQLCLPAGPDQGISPARSSCARHRAHPAARQRPARQRRSHVSCLVRPVLGGPEGQRAPDRARGVAGGAGGGRGRVAADAHAIAARERRAPGGQDDVPAAAGRTTRGRGLDGVRSRRGRPDGGPAVVRPARGAHPAHRGRAGGRQEAHLVYPRHPANGAQRHASGTGGERARPDPSGSRLRPADRVDGSDADEHGTPAAAASHAAQPVRGRASRAAVPGGDDGAGTGLGRPPGGRGRAGDRSPTACPSRSAPRGSI